MHIPRQRRHRPGIDMGPLIDCVFQLLIFFMLSSTLLTPMIELKLPQASVTDRPEHKEIMVTVDESGKMFVNTRPVDVSRLEAELRLELTQSPDKNVTFRGDEKMHYKHFVQVLDAARRCGAVNINISHRIPER